MGCRQKDVRVLRRGHVTALPARLPSVVDGRGENAAVNGYPVVVCSETNPSPGSEKGNALVTRWFNKSQPRTGHTREPDPTHNELKHTITRKTRVGSGTLRRQSPRQS